MKYAVERSTMRIVSYQGNACVWESVWVEVKSCATLFEARLTYDGVLAGAGCGFMPLRIVEVMAHTEPPLAPPNRYWRQ